MGDSIDKLYILVRPRGFPRKHKIFFFCLFVFYTQYVKKNTKKKRKVKKGTKSETLTPKKKEEKKKPSNVKNTILSQPLESSPSPSPSSSCGHAGG